MGADGYGTAKAKSEQATDPLSQTGREVLNSFLKAGSDFLRSAESALGTLTGKKVLEKVAECVPESTIFGKGDLHK